MVLSQKNLPLRQDKTFFKRAQRSSTPHFLLFWEKLGAPEEKTLNFLSQVSIIVPKHQLKTSVQRHRVKRQFRSAWLRLSSTLAHPTRVVFTVNRAAQKLSPTELENQLSAQIAKINEASKVLT
jgi:ribonuclease P protein component